MGNQELPVTKDGYAGDRSASSSDGPQQPSEAAQLAVDLCRAEESLLPFFESPFPDLGDEFDGPAHRRSETNLIELFFDLFLAADLATFTAKHSVVDQDSLIGYIGFFVIIWSTWFQITLHDVRFASDSVYERACKIMQFIIFVAFALVGSDFKRIEGTAKSSPHKQVNFWSLSFTLFTSRLLLAVQYLVVFMSRNRPARLKTPLLINVIVFLITSSVFVGCMGLFAKYSDPTARGSALGYIIWYLLLIFELISVLYVSGVWPDLNFQATHLTERMGLLTFIVIGEGAIGACKTTIEIMADRRLQAESVFLMFCIVLVLVLIWTSYFDGMPSMTHSPAWQQVWACLHLPLHLAFVGVLEGSRQVAVIRYISHALKMFVSNANRLCLQQHAKGEELEKGLMRLIDTFDFGMMYKTAEQSAKLRELVEKIVDLPDICSPSNTEGVTSIFNVSSLPKFPYFEETLFQFAKALLTSDGAEDLDAKAEKDAFLLVQKSVVTVYLYYWAATLTLLLTFVLLYRLNVPRRIDVTDYLSMGGRLIMAILAAVFLALHSDPLAWMTFIGSLAMLPSLVSMLSSVVIIDWIGRRLRVRRLRRKVKDLPPIETEWQPPSDGNGRSSFEIEKIENFNRQGHHDRAHDHHALAQRRQTRGSGRFSIYDWLMPAYDYARESGQFGQRNTILHFDVNQRHHRRRAYRQSVSGR